MLKTGNEYLESIRDGRVIYIGGERVEDVPTHPAFRNAAQSFAMLYDRKADPAHRDTMSFAEDGGRYSMYYLMPRNRDDLLRRMRAHKLWGDMSYGLLGRSPDHVASFVTGMAMQPEIFDRCGQNFSGNLLAYYRHLRENDLYAAYAVLPPAGARSPAFYQYESRKVPTLRVTAEDAKGVTLNGMKMLATGGVFAHEIWVGNLLPLGPGQEKESITCAVPVNAPGLSLWSRKPFERYALNQFDNPLSSRFDETDSMVIFADVTVPWEKVFTHDQVDHSREIYILTAGHCFGNHQSNVRFWSKLRLLVGLASRIAQAGGVSEVPTVRETLGRLAAMEAALAGMIYGQCEDYENLPNGYVCFNRRYMYAALNWCQENYVPLCTTVRELCGGSVFQMPADISVVSDPKLHQTFDDYWSTPTHTAVERMKLYKLAWDLLGSEFGSRHLQYENFYAGPSFIVRNHSFRECNWEQFHKIVDDLLASYDVPAEFNTTLPR